MHKSIKIGAIFLLLPLFSISQEFIRIKAAYSIKIKTSTGISQLSMGNIFYDKNIDKIVYENKYPREEIWVTKDTISYKLLGGGVVNTIQNINMNKLTVFYLALSGNLNDFGLTNSKFSIEKVEKDKGLVITTWLPPTEYRKLIHKILISNKNGQLSGIVMIDSEEKVISKQFFRKYIIANGLLFPTEIVQISYSTEGKENYQITTFRDIQVNDFKKDFMYDYPITY